MAEIFVSELQVVAGAFYGHLSSVSVNVIFTECVDERGSGEDMGMLHNCGLLPNNCLSCLAGTTTYSDEKRKSITSSPRKKPALRLSFKWKDGHANPTLCDVARVNGQLEVARAFGDKSLKEQLS